MTAILRLRCFSVTEPGHYARPRPTLSEDYLARLRGRQLKGAKFRRQHPIVYVLADFFCLEARRVIELDGSQHREERNQQADEARTAYLEGQGYRVLRFWNEEVLDDIDGVLERIAEFL